MNEKAVKETSAKDVATQGLIWSFIDKVGPLAPWAAALVALVIFGAAYIAGPSLEWLGFFYIFSILLLLLYIPYQVRRNRRLLAAREAERVRLHEIAKAEVTRMVLEESSKQSGKDKPSRK